MKRLLLLIILSPVFTSGFGQMMSIYDYTPLKSYKVNLFADTATGSVFPISAIDSIGKSGTAVSLHSVRVRSDTAIWTVSFAKPVKSTETPFYKRWFHQPFSDYAFKDIDGRVIKSPDLKGKIVLVNFWSISCGPCIAEMPALNRMVDSIKGLSKGSREICFLGIAWDGKKELLPFLEKHPFHYTVVPDGQPFADAMGVIGYPTNIILDENGIVVSIIEGVPFDKNTRELLSVKQIAQDLKDLENK